MAVRTCAALLAASVCVHVVLSAQQPVFRATEALGRLEVTVLDSRTRKPVRGLQASDFEVKLAGDVQTVTTVAEVTNAAEKVAALSAFPESALDTNTNLVRPERLFVIVFDDASGSPDPFERKTGKEIANRVVDAMQPGDLAAVVFEIQEQYSQDFTADRTLLRNAIDRFNPRGVPGTSVLNRIREFMLRVQGPRKAIFHISSDGPGSTTKSEIARTKAPVWPLQTVAGLDRSLGGLVGNEVSHVPVYAFNTRGLVAPNAKDIMTGQLNSNRDAEAAALAVARETGGRAVVAHNKPSVEVPAIFDELSSHYVLGYRPTAKLDGALRWLQVSVKRPGLVVMPSDVPIKTADPDAVVAARLQKDRESGLLAIIGAPYASGDLPLSLATGVFPTSTPKQHAIVLTLALPAELSKQEYDIDLRVFDAIGRRELHSAQSRVSVPAGAEGTPTELLLRFDVEPGRYSVRLSATEVGAGARAGVVAATAVAPDLGRTGLALSGLAITRVGTRQPGGRALVDGLLPTPPTAARSFLPSDNVGAFMTIHQRERRQALSATVQVEVLDVNSQVVVEETRTYPPTAFKPGHGAELRFDLPLKRLSPGAYLLRVVATAGTERVQRDVQFSIRP